MILSSCKWLLHLKNNIFWNWNKFLTPLVHLFGPVHLMIFTKFPTSTLFGPVRLLETLEYLPLTTFLLDNVEQTMRWTLGPYQQNRTHHHTHKKNACQSCTLLCDHKSHSMLESSLDLKWEFFCSKGFS